MPSGNPKFQSILVDPPFSFATYSRKGTGRSAEAYYDTMSVEDIMAMPVPLWAADDCILFCWTPKSSLLQGLKAVESWGFIYKTVAFTWVKARVPFDETAPHFAFGMGYWTRQNTEICLLATKGRPKRINADVSEVIFAPRGEHSVKPSEIYPAIERLVAGPYLELFASAAAPARTGWTRRIGKDRAAVRRWGYDRWPGADTEEPLPNGAVSDNPPPEAA